MMKTLALFAIQIYQKYISPYKGFCCAYRHHTGHASCSSLGYRTIRIHGFLKGMQLLTQRTKKCGVAYLREAKKFQMHNHSQRGFCDVGCDLPVDCNFDLPSFSFGKSGFFSTIFDNANCCDCGSCDWSSNTEKKKKDAEYVYIPPHKQNKNSI